MADHTVTLELYYSGAWHPAPAYTRDGLTIMRGAATPGAQMPPGSADPTIDNRTGNYSPRNVAGALYGLLAQNMPARVTVDGDVRITGEVPLWKPERAIKGDAWTKTQIVGILQRIGRGNDPLAGPAQRSILAAGPLMYLPLTDGRGASSAVDLTGDGPGIDVVGAPGLASVAGPGAGDTMHPELVGTGGYVGGFSGNINAATTGEWTVEFGYRAVAPLDDAQAVVAQWHVSGTYGGIVWLCYVAKIGGTHGVVVVAHHDALTSTAFNETGIPLLDGEWHQVRVTANQNTATQVTINLYVDDNLTDTTTVSTYTVGNLTSLTLGDYGGTLTAYPFADVDSLAVSHWAAWSDSAPASTYDAFGGYDGETADDRFLRICDEEGIDASIVGTAGDAVLMGPQASVTLLELFAEIERTDDATIFEDRDSAALVMRTGASKLNQAPDLTLYYNGGQIAPPLEVVVGDEHIRNDVTAASPGGAVRRVQQLTGTYNVQAPPSGVGRYATRIDVNPELDDALSDAAGWRINHGTYDGTWYAAITVDLDAAPQLATLAAAIDIGDCVRLASLPVDEALDAVDHIVIGIKEDLPPKRRTITFYCVPAAPYQVGLLAATSGDTDPFVGRLETDGSTTVAAVDSTEFFWDGFETGVSAWSASSGWAVAASATHVRTGASAMRLTPPGAVASGGAILTGRTPATAGRTYVAEVWFYSVAGWADARAAVDWRNAAGGVISSSLGSATVVPAGVWTASRQVFTAPALTASAQLRARQGGTPAVGDVLWVDDASFTPQLSIATPSGPVWTTASDDFPMEVIVGGQVVSISAVTGSSSPQTFAVSVGEPPAYAIPAGSAVTVAQPIILAL